MATPYQIVASPPRGGCWRYPQIEDLKPGEAFLVPWGDLACNEDGHHAVRSYAWVVGKRLRRKFRTKKVPTGIFIICEAVYS